MPTPALPRFSLDACAISERQPRGTVPGSGVRRSSAYSITIRARASSLAMQHVAQSTKGLGVVRVLLAYLHQHALGRAQVALLEKRASEQNLFADVGSVRRQCGPYYPNWPELACSGEHARRGDVRAPLNWSRTCGRPQVAPTRDAKSRWAGLDPAAQFKSVVQGADRQLAVLAVDDAGDLYL